MGWAAIFKGINVGLNGVYWDPMHQCTLCVGVWVDWRGGGWVWVNEWVGGWMNKYSTQHYNHTHPQSHTRQSQYKHYTTHYLSTAHVHEYAVLH